MKKIAVIFKKEFKDILRDRRTIMMMVVLPILLIYIFMNLSISLSRSQTRKAEEKSLKVALFKKGDVETFRAILEKQKNIIIEENVDIDKIKDLIQGEELDFAIVFDETFDGQVSAKTSGNVDLFYKGSRENNIAKRRIRSALKEFDEKLLSLRLQDLNQRYDELQLDRSFVEPIKVNEKDLATQKEKIGESIGGLLPYFFIIFCFLGAMYPAIDLGAGEKERATIETLLTSPASRMQIVLGKFFVITCTGIISAIISILALYLAMKQAQGVPQGALEGILRIVEYKSIGLLFSLLVPVCVFFAAVLLSISIFARSFKEAQSIMTPMNILVIIPVFIGLFPGIKLNTTTALIPVLNVSLATKEIISGTIKTGLLLEAYVSLFVLAALSLVFCAQWFKREEVIFRGI
ncbi:MAG: ABC transporter permease [Candidatus Aminicenantes bacterium]|jgi:sodium transport system permease protein